MRQVEQKLKEWNLLYQQLKAAREELTAGDLDDPAERAQRKLRVAQLQKDADSALDAVHSALSATKVGSRQ